MIDWEKVQISAKVFNNLKEYEESDKLDKSNREVIEIKEYTKEDILKLRAKGFFLIPSYVTHIRKTDVMENIISNLSKNKRKKIKKGIKEGKKFELIIESPVTKETYANWYKNVYVKSLNEKKIGIVYAKEDWYETHLDKSVKVGVFLKNNGKIIAGIVARSFSENKFLPKRLSISFSAILSKYKDLKIGDYINLIILEEAYKLGFENISKGKDPNIYGKHISAGIPIFKTSLGYNMTPLEKEGKILIKPNNLDEFDDIIFFTSYDNDDKKLTGNLIFKKEFDENIINQYCKKYFSSLKVYEYENKQLKLKREIECFSNL